MHRWKECTMSPSLISTLPPSLQDTGKRAAHEGSAAHRLGDLGVQWIAEHLSGPRSLLRDVLLFEMKGLRIAQLKGTNDWEVVGNCPFSGDTLASNDNVYLDWNHDVFTVDDDMQAGVRRYLEEVLNIIDQCEGTPVVQAETRCYPVPIRDDIFGTSDCVIYDPVSDRLWVIDFKYGRRMVFALDNPQALFYAAGAVEQFDAKGEVTLVIVQPRVEFPDGRDVSVDVKTANQVVEWRENVLEAKIVESETPALAQYKVGSWCEFCPASQKCPLMQKEAIRKAREAFADDLEALPFEDVPDVELVMPDPEDAGQLSAALKIAEVLEIWTKRVRETADIVGRSKPIPGFKLVRKQTKRRWKDEGRVLQELKKHEAFAEGTTDPKPKSPSQLEKLKALPQDLIDELSEKPMGALVLAPESDSRKAIEKADQVFTDIG
jgi:hypothetical protein